MTFRGSTTWLKTNVDMEQNEVLYELEEMFEDLYGELEEMIPEDEEADNWIFE